jgi:hypothetical protein
VAKTAGMGDNCYIGGYDLSGDVGSLSRIGGGPAALEVTAINASAFERLGGVRDGGLEFSSWFNAAAGQAHPVLSALPTANVVGSYFRGTAIGNPAASLVAKQINYDGNRQPDGSFSFAVSMLPNGYGLEWGDQLTAGKRTDTGATAGTAFDSGAATTNFGLQAYLQVFSFVGTDVTIKLQESSDNAGDAYADVTGGGFTQVTAGPTTQRIATATNLAVERYLKVTTVTTGGFTSCVFAVMVVRNLAAPTF